MLQLNALACKMDGKGSMSGRVLLNGQPYTDRDFRRWGVYVMQAEPMLNTATVSGHPKPIHGKQSAVNAEGADCCRSWQLCASLHR